MAFETREPARVREATCEVDEDHDVIVPWIHVEGLDGGWGQGFGGLILDEKHAEDWKVSICALFGVKELVECEGRNCFALRAWPTWGTDIEGIEVDGCRFTLTEFRRKHWPNEPADPLSRRRNAIINDINWHGSRIVERASELHRLADGYVDWSRSPHAKDQG